MDSVTNKLTTDFENVSRHRGAKLIGKVKRIIQVDIIHFSCQIISFYQLVKYLDR